MSVLYTDEEGAPSRSSPRSLSPGSSIQVQPPSSTNESLRANACGGTIILPPEMRSVLWGCYQLATGVALLAAGPVLLARRGSHYLPTLSGRLGRSTGPPPV